MRLQQRPNPESPLSQYPVTIAVSWNIALASGVKEIMNTDRPRKNFLRRLASYYVGALLTALVITFLYDRMLITTRYHGLAVAALGPAIDLIWHHLDPTCYQNPMWCHFEVLAGNVWLYSLWIWLGLCVMEVARHTKRLLSP